MVGRRILGWVGGGVLLLALGAGAGVLVARTTTDDTTTISQLVPVPAESPSYPAGTVEVLPDPKTPALQPGLPTHPAQVGPKDFGVRLPVPIGWTRRDTDAVESKWTDPAQPDINTFLLRAKLISSQRLTIAQAVDARLTALRGVVDDFRIESQTDDSFVATYVTDDHRRLAFEKFLALDGSESAQVTIVTVGRLSDRAGLQSLFDTAVAGAIRPPR